MKWRESCLVVSNSLRPHGLYSPWNSPGQNTGVGSLSLLQGIFPTQGLNPVSRIAGRFFYQLSHGGGPRILEWVAYLFSSRSSRPRNWTGVSCVAGGFFTNWTIREAQILNRCFLNTTKYLIGKLLRFWKNWLEKRCSWGFKRMTENRVSAGKKTCLLRCIVNDGWEIPLLLCDSCTY